jgi:hypothetical protein
MVVTTQIVKKRKEKERKKGRKKEQTNEGRENIASYSTREPRAHAHMQ